MIISKRYLLIHWVLNYKFTTRWLRKAKTKQPVNQCAARSRETESQTVVEQSALVVWGLNILDISPSNLRLNRAVRFSVQSHAKWTAWFAGFIVSLLLHLLPITMLTTASTRRRRRRGRRRRSWRSRWTWTWVGWSPSGCLYGPITSSPPWTIIRSATDCNSRFIFIFFSVFLIR